MIGRKGGELTIKAVEFSLHELNIDNVSHYWIGPDIGQIGLTALDAH